MITQPEKDTAAEGFDIQAVAVAGQILDVQVIQRKFISAAEVACGLYMTTPEQHADLGLEDGQGRERGFILEGWLVQLEKRAAVFSTQDKPTRCYAPPERGSSTTSWPQWVC